MSMTSMFDTLIDLSDVTPEILDRLVSTTYMAGRSCRNKQYLDVLTARGKSRSVTVLKRADGSLSWHVWSPQNGWAAANMTKEFQKVLTPEKAKKAEQRKQSKREQNAPDGTVKVGSVFASAGGYDATIWHFYQVVSITPTGKTVQVRELAQETRDSAVGPCCWQCRPVLGVFRGAACQHRVNYQYHSIHITSWESAFLMKDSELGEWQEADNYH